MNIIDKLASYFDKFPGIGHRQSRRFVFFLLSQDEKFLNEIVDLIKNIRKDISICGSCSRFYENENNELCRICRDKNRDKETLMLVGKDEDLNVIEKTSIYTGKYFVLGGLVPILEKTPEKKIRIEKLKNLIITEGSNGTLKEIILALNLNPDGENTANYLKKALREYLEKYKIKITTLGRGLSTGTELEYSDESTIKNALLNRGKISI